SLHGASVLELLAPPGVDQLAALERRIGRLAGVHAEYGPVAWLRSQIAAISAAVAAHATARVPRAALLDRYGATGGLTIDDQTLAANLAFGSGVEPLRSLAWLFPDGSTARIYVRLASGTMARRVKASLAAQ